MMTRPRGELAGRITALPQDTNINGDIFAGWLFSQMDLATSVMATKISNGRAVTIGIESMAFKKPVNVRDVVSFYVENTKIGRTSMTFNVEAWVNSDQIDQAQQVTSGKFTFVAIDNFGKPRAVDQLVEDITPIKPRRIKQSPLSTIAPKGALTHKITALPKDTNANHDIFGGWLFFQMDAAASVMATRLSNGRAATVGIESMTFKQPVRVGDILSVYVNTKNIGNSSMTFEVEAWVNIDRPELCQLVTTGKFTYVAIDKQGKPRPVIQATDTTPPATPPHSTARTTDSNCFYLMALIGLASCHIGLMIGIVAISSLLTINIAVSLPLIGLSAAGIGFFHHQLLKDTVPKSNITNDLEVHNLKSSNMIMEHL